VRLLLRWPGEGCQALQDHDLLLREEQPVPDYRPNGGEHVKQDDARGRNRVPGVEMPLIVRNDAKALPFRV